MIGSVNRFCSFLALCLLPALTWAADENALVKRVLNGKNLLLEDGRPVRLAAIQAPNPGEPMAEEAKAALARLVEGKRVTLKPVKDSPDRRGRIVAFVVDDRGREVQGELLRDGMAMVYTFPDTANRADALLALEREARDHKRGIWMSPYFAVVDERDARARRDRFTVVEGTIRKVEARKDATYLNFGDDWKTDFTLAVDKRHRSRYFKGIDLGALEGKRVRARGWIYSKNGPMIDLTHPGQMEMLTASDRPALPSP